MTDHHDTQRTMRAQIRGAKAAGIYRNLCQRLRTWDTNCVVKAHKHNLPVWVGHLPVYLFVGSSAIALLLGSLAIAGIIILIFGLLLGLSQTNKGETLHFSNTPEDENGYRNGYEGYGYYMGGFRVDSDDN
ncbi:hypothetical protein [Photorhabdus luminescens]|uniref:DUF3742 domain-containing protein n=1 Tax=Photorhabdus luminescens subsp. sonorensis TaxID=1173677 RepID=A0A5C4REN3_PHOLU|nr:hypothetical protein [Photorhabdus luminescens]TNH42248.1 hypothetical protein EP164_18095 [Photorhabdus luminescens subsp. sonorensis]